MAEIPNYKIAVMSKLLDLSERHIRRLANEGILKKPEKNKGWEITNVTLYIRYLRERAFGTNVGETDIYQQKLRLTRNQADYKELEVAELTGKLIDTLEVIHLWQDMIANCRSKLLNIAPKVTHQVIGMTEYGEVENLINDEIHEALNELAKEPIPKATSGNLEQVDSDIQSTRKAKGKSMVGQIQSSD